MKYPITHKRTDVIFRTVLNDVMVSPDSDITENEDSFEFLATAEMTDNKGNFTGEKLQIKSKIYKIHIVAFEKVMTIKDNNTKKYMA